MTTIVQLHDFAASSVRFSSRFVVLCALGFFFFGAGMSARALDNFSADWFTVDGGGASMSGGVFSLEGTSGQPDAGLITLANGEQLLKGGFWALDFSQLGNVSPTIQIQRTGLSEVTLSWYPDTPGFRLQQSLTLKSDSWTTLSSAPANPSVLPLDMDHLFFRLLKP